MQTEMLNSELVFWCYTLTYPCKGPEPLYQTGTCFMFDHHSWMIVNYHDINLDHFSWISVIFDSNWHRFHVFDTRIFLVKHGIVESWNPEMPWKTMKCQKSKLISWLFVIFYESWWKLMEFICQFPQAVMKFYGLIR